MDLGLKGLNAVVTGGSRGIGRSAADILADEGANVAICARNAGEVASTVVAALKTKGVIAFGATVDVADKAALEDFVAQSAKALGGVDIVVANVSALAVQDNEEAWRKAFETDMMHTVRAVNAALPYLEASKHPADRDRLLGIGAGGRLHRPGLRRVQGRVDPLCAAAGVPACAQINSRERGLAGQHLFRRRRVAANRDA